MSDVELKKVRGSSKRRSDPNDLKVVRCALLVLGMHRSGTSAVASVLSRLGAAEPKTLLNSTRDNPKGYSESRVIMEFNNRLLSSAGTGWSDIDAFNKAWMLSPVSEAFKREALEIIRSEFADSNFISLKDPRICRFAGFWLERLAEAGYDTRIVIPYRNPLEVAESLRKRDGFSLGYSLLLWLRHVLDAEAATRDCIRSFVGYDEMLHDWEGAVRRIGRDLNISWPRWSAAVRDEIELFLSAELRHNMSSEQDLLESGRVPGLVKAAYTALANLAGGGEPREMIFRKLNELRAQFNTVCEIAAPALAHGRAAEDQLLRQTKTMQASTDQMETLRRENENLKTKLASLMEAGKQHNERAVSFRSEIESAKSRLASQAEEIGRHQTKVVELTKELHLLKQNLAMKEEECSRLNQNFKLSKSEVERLTASHAAERRDAHSSQERLSKNLDNRFKELAKLTNMLMARDRELESVANQLTVLKKALADENERAAVLQKKLVSERERTTAMQKKLADENERVNVLQKKLAYERARNSRETAAQLERDKQLVGLKDQNSHEKAERLKAERVVKAMQNSNSWRLTSPLRAVGGWIKRLK